MGSKSKIEWTDATWSPVTGCTKVSEGCGNCYAERQAKRLAGRAGYPKEHPFSVTLHPERLDEPLRWRKPRRIFVCSMSDLFHPEVADEFVDRVLETMLLASQHTYQVLTKHPDRMAAYLARIRPTCRTALRWPFSFLWLGTSIEDQAAADERIPHLLQCVAAVRFVSYEPALGPVDFRRLDHAWLDALAGRRVQYVDKLNAAGLPSGGEYSVATGAKIDWVIAGGESGPRARPAHPDWFRSVRDQCRAAAVPFFFKGWGEWALEPRPDIPDKRQRMVPFETGCGHGSMMARLGKKAAGRLLDGVEHNEYPGERVP